MGGRGHAVRGAVTAWLALITLQTVVSKGGSGKVAGAFAGIAGFVDRALDPTVPAIPDRRAGAVTYSQPGPITPAQAAAGAKVAANLPGIDAVTGPGGALGNLPSLQQYVNGGGLPSGLLNNPALRP